MRDDDRNLVEALRRIGSKPCLAIASFFEEADEHPEKVMEKAREMEARLPEAMMDLDALLENARAIAQDLLADAEQKAARLEALKAAGTVDALVEHAERLLYEGEVAEAKVAFAEAVERTEAAFGPEARELVVPLMGLARSSGQAAGGPGATPGAGSMDEELALQRRAVAIAEATMKPNDLLLAEVVHAYGVSTWASGDATAAIVLLRKSLEVAERAGADKAPFLAPLIGALLDAKRAPEALPHARELLALEEGGAETDLTTLFVVGQAFRDGGAFAEARIVLERFLESYGEGGNPAIRDEVRGWLAKLPPAN